jgi:cytoskeletal protein RodZ
VSEGEKTQQDVALSPGALLKEAREAHELSLREVADRLHLMPGYPAIIERDEFHALRHPAFARGYVKAYGKLLGVDETRLLEAFDALQAEAASPEPRKVRTPPLQLQHTGFSVIVGLLLLVLLIAAIWWWRAEPVARAQATLAPVGESPSAQWDRDPLMTGES